MKRSRIRGLLTATALLTGGAVTADEPTQATFTGGFSIGVRSVDVGGAERKFREDFNLEDGPRLFNLHFNLIPSPGDRKFADQVTFEANNLGGDPFETMHLGIRRYGAYQFDYHRTKSDYFYSDLLIPAALIDLNKSNAGDFHHFDFERVRDRAKLAIDISQAAQLTFGMERFTRRGESTTTLDVSRDEFELDRPIEQSMNSYYGAFRYAWDKMTLTVEERVRDYNDSYEIFLPGQSPGENTEDSSVLDFFFLDQPYDVQGNTHIVRLLTNPTDRLHIRFHGLLQDLEMEATAEERSKGTAFNGVPFEDELSGGGTVDREMNHFSVEASFAATERVALVFEGRQQAASQDGAFAWENALNNSAWDIDTTGLRAGVRFDVSPQLTVNGGIASESRDVDFRWAVDGEGKTGSETTDRTGLYAGAAWRPSKDLDVTVDLEDNSFDDPFTLASPTDRTRYRVRGRYRFGEGWTASAAYTVRDYDNSDSGWVSDTDIGSLRLSRTDDRLAFSFGYSMVDAERIIDQLVQGGSISNLFAIRYLSESSFLNGNLRWKANDWLTLGGDFRMYDNDGSFGIERDDFRGYVEVPVFGAYSLQAGYRTVDYDETEFDFDDYDADMLELALGYNW